MLMIALFLAAAAEPEQIRITRNYSAEYNTAVKARPAADLAKPILCQAWKVMKPWEGERATHPVRARPAEGTPEWARALEWLKLNTEAVEHLRRAGAKPAAGWLMLDAIEPELRDAVGGEERTPRENPELPSMMLSYLAPARQSIELLEVDATAARRAGDAARWWADVTCLAGLGGQLLDEPTIIAQLIGRVAYSAAFAEIKRAVADRRHSFDAALWEKAAARLEQIPKGRGLRLHAEGEEWIIRDAIQRTYTDDGAGDGRLSREGFKYIWGFVRESGPGGKAKDDEGGEELTYGMYAGQFASRKQETELTTKIFAQFASWDGAMIGKVDLKPYAELYDGLEKAHLKHPPLSLFLADLTRCYSNLEQLRQDADGMRLVLAAERFRLKTGHPPATAAELVPAYLPSVPADRWTGGPLKYAVREGGFTVYSAGADQDDDQGTPAGPGNPFVPAASWWDKPAGKRPSGDYVIYPGVER